ncbi:SDR family oxidoreductase [Cesiribacter sp. SM1]|uniref:SDR family oxidoreductase n=1 Tax=Cesiribacter sp. SM1 TaxID=2861196 RepID=UPI001CD48934|nr:SDR family oxidoreductase [Cesiribacter sp. SM1]
MKKTDEFRGKTVVITGGGGILCQSFARTLAERGARVAILDLNGEAARAVAQEILAAGGEALGVEANVLDADSLKRAHEAISIAFGPCDILINGAGGNHPKGTTSQEYLLKEHLKEEAVTTFFDLDPVGIQFVFDLNFLGTFLPTREFALDMVEKEQGVVLNVSSMSSLRPLTRIPAYSGAKSAVSNFTQWLAVYFAKVGIRVNALAPGFFLTDQNRSLLTSEDGGLTARGNTIIAHTPMQRFGTAADLDGALLWLCGSDSAFVTGVVIPIDGGFSAYSGV